MLEEEKKQWAQENERMETERKEKEQEEKAQQEKEQKCKEEQERKDSEMADASEMREFVQNVLTQRVVAAPDAPGMSNVCASTGCKQDRKKKCSFGMCIGCSNCDLLPALFRESAIWARITLAMFRLKFPVSVCVFFFYVSHVTCSKLMFITSILFLDSCLLSCPSFLLLLLVLVPYSGQTTC